MSNLKALILLASRPETGEVAIERLEPEVVDVIDSQELLETVMLKCLELSAQGAEFLCRVVDSSVEIWDASEWFEHLLSEPEDMGYRCEQILLDVSETQFRAEHAWLRGL